MAGRFGLFIALAILIPFPVAAAPANQGDAEIMMAQLSLEDLDAVMEEDAEAAEAGVMAALAEEAWGLALLGTFFALALWSFISNSERLKIVTLVVAVGYLGFFKNNLVSVVDILSVVDGNFPTFRYSVRWYVLGLFAIVTTVLWGRFYCGRICAFGALTQLMDRLLPARWRMEPPKWLERRAGYIKFAILGGAIIYFLISRDNAFYRYIEPFWMFTLSGSPVMWTLLGLLLLATVFVKNLYCRFLCPLGAALGLLSQLTVFRIKRWSECGRCKICENTCEWGAIRGPKIVYSECVRCDDCERLYHDKAACPHWLLQAKQARREANRKATMPDSAA
jgi:NosR/NirI family nitrous oxide reductase transcriptional regulator